MKNKNKVMNVIIVALCVVFVIAALSFVREFSDYSSIYAVKEDSFLYCLQSGNYGEMVDRMKQNQGEGVELTQTYEECYAVAEYFEAASLYKAYMLDGNMEKASQQKERMEDAATRMGEFSYAIGDMNKRLGLEE